MVYGIEPDAIPILGGEARFKIELWVEESSLA